MKKLRYTLELIKFSHTIFALPFVLVAYLSATRGKFELIPLAWILICVLFARTAAMAFNRLADASYDAQNPRTKDRHIPSGKLSRKYVILLIIICSTGFIFSAYQLNRLAFFLSPFCLALLFLYSLTKRFTHFTQFFLGLALAIAPIGTTIAILGKFTLTSIVLGGAVFFWVSGFDLLYALQDLEFDRNRGLHSLTVKLGKNRTFYLARCLHLCFWLSLLLYGYLANFGIFYWAGITLTGVLLFWQHWLLRNNLDNIQAAFFNTNGILSCLFFLFVLTDLYLSPLLISS